MQFRWIGPFTVLGDLGGGARSRVFRVRREVDGREYALKVVTADSRADRKYLDQVRHEFRVGGLLDHPHLMRVYCLETDGGWLAGPRRARLLTEFASGDPLDRAAPAPARLPAVFERVADALAHMHERGVIHGDLKPGNLILGRGADVKVIDFGLAQVAGEPRGRVQGTPGYMAPETEAHGVVSERTDVFNLEVTMYRLVTGRTLPLVNPGPCPAWCITSRSVPAVAERPATPRAGLADLIRACVAPRPEDRPQRMRDVQAVLRHLVLE